MKYITADENHVINVSLAVIAVGLIAGPVLAGTGGTTEFTAIHDQLSLWVNGTLGKTLGIAALLVGLGIGVIKQSVMAAVVGVSVALVAGYGPDVIDSVVTAALPITSTI